MSASHLHPRTRRPATLANVHGRQTGPGGQVLQDGTDSLRHGGDVAYGAQLSWFSDGTGGGRMSRAIAKAFKRDTNNRQAGKTGLGREDRNRKEENRDEMLAGTKQRIKVVNGLSIPPDQRRPDAGWEAMGSHQRVGRQCVGPSLSRGFGLPRGMTAEVPGQNWPFGRLGRRQGSETTH